MTLPDWLVQVSLPRATLSLLPSFSGRFGGEPREIYAEHVSREALPTRTRCPGGRYHALARCPSLLFVSARLRRVSLPCGRSRLRCRRLETAIPGAADALASRSARWCFVLVVVVAMTRAFSRDQCLAHIDDSTRRETHGYGCHFGASGRALAGSASQFHPSAWRIIIIALVGRLGGVRCVMFGSSFCAPFCVRCLGLSRAGVRLSLGVWWPAGYCRDRLTCAQAAVPCTCCGAAGFARVGPCLVALCARRGVCREADFGPVSCRGIVFRSRCKRPTCGIDSTGQYGVRKPLRTPGDVVMALKLSLATDFGSSLKSPM